MMDRKISKSEKSGLKWKKIAKVGLICAAVIIAIVLGAGWMSSSVKKSDLTIAEADMGSIEITVSGTGKVVPAFEEVITSPINSRIIKIFCQAGDSVEAGTPLMLLDLQNTETEVNKLNDEIAIKQHELEQQHVSSETRVSDLEIQLEVKEMTLNRLEAELRNERYLDSIGSGTGDQVQQAELAVKTARLEIKQLRQQLENERRMAQAGDNVKNLDINIARKNLNVMEKTLGEAGIYAPRSAILTFILDKTGEKVSEGQKLAVIADLDHFKVDAEISDNYVNRVNIGSRAIVRIGKEKLGGTVSNLTPQSQNGVIKFTVRLDDDSHPRLRSGLKTDVYISCDVVDDAVRLPAGAYYTGAGTYNLFCMDKSGNKLVRKEVKLGESNYEYVEVISGVTPGEKVVISNLSDFRNSSSLRLR